MMVIARTAMVKYRWWQNKEPTLALNWHAVSSIRWKEQPSEIAKLSGMFLIDSIVTAHGEAWKSYQSSTAEIGINSGPS